MSGNFYNIEIYDEADFVKQFPDFRNKIEALIANLRGQNNNFEFSQCLGENKDNLEIIYNNYSTEQSAVLSILPNNEIEFSINSD